MSKLSIFKTVTELVVSSGVGAIVNNAVRATTPIPVEGQHKVIRIANKVAIGAGTIFLSSALGGFAAKQASKEIDEVVEAYQNAKAGIAEVKGTFKEGYEQAPDDISSL